MDEPADPDRSRSLWRRIRVPLVVLPLLVGLAAAGVVGADLLLRGPADDAGSERCWNGDRAASGDCPTPSGTEGLEWVFPRFDATAEGCEERDAGEEARTVTEWRCTTRVGGRPVEIAYREVADAERRLAFLERYYRDADRTRSGDGGRILWRTPGPDRTGRYALASAYRSYPFDLTLWAPTAALRDEAVRRLVRFRAVDDVTTEPPD